MSIELNPYHPSSSASVEVSNLSAAASAGKGRRFGTLVVDYICYIALSAAIGVVVALVGGEAWMAALEGINSYILSLGLFFLYYLGFESAWGRTPGKFIMGTVVCNEHGDKPGFGQLVKRTCARFIPFEPFSFFGEQGWHDSMSDTRVVMCR